MKTKMKPREQETPFSSRNPASNRPSTGNSKAQKFLYRMKQEDTLTNIPLPEKENQKDFFCMKKESQLEKLMLIWQTKLTPTRLDIALGLKGLEN